MDVYVCKNESRRVWWNWVFSCSILNYVSLISTHFLSGRKLSGSFCLKHFVFPQSIHRTTKARHEALWQKVGNITNKMPFNNSIPHVIYQLFNWINKFSENVCGAILLTAEALSLRRNSCLYKQHRYTSISSGLPPTWMSEIKLFRVVTAIILILGNIGVWWQKSRKTAWINFVSASHHKSWRCALDRKMFSTRWTGFEMYGCRFT
jgi:hypothetical protein